ncbi:MAG: hypothetical protein K2W95_27825 [Candidatus Obscuribacterales bacterium]|nr:hypothetical protein [Candidatus Obscuribacterales bacterium]
MPPSELPALTRAEVLGAASTEKSDGWSNAATSAWDKSASLATKAYNIASEHPVETALATVAAAGVFYFGTRSLASRCVTARTTAGALAEPAEVTIKAFRPKVLEASSAIVSELKCVPELLPRQTAHIEVIGGLKHLPEALQGQGVGQATFAIAKAEVPLATRGLSTRGALVVQSEKQGLHYLAHLDCGVTPSQIRSSLSLFDLSQSRIFLMKGPKNYMVDSIVVEALSTTPGALRALRFVEGAVEANGITYGMASYRNGLYKFSQNMRAWPTFETGQPTASLLKRLGLGQLRAS